MVSTLQSFLPYLQELAIVQLRSPEFKTFILTVSGTRKSTYHHSSPARARICGATSQRVWSGSQMRNVRLQQLVLSHSLKLLHRHHFLQLRVAVFFHFNRNFAIFNPALVLQLEKSLLLFLLTVVLMFLTCTKPLNRSVCACRLSTQAAISCLPSMPSQSNNRQL